MKGRKKDLEDVFRLAKVSLANTGELVELHSSCLDNATLGQHSLTRFWDNLTGDGRELHKS